MKRCCPNETIFAERTVATEASSRIVNYTKARLIELLPRDFITHNNHSTRIVQNEDGLTQESYLLNEEHDDTTLSFEQEESNQEDHFIPSRQFLSGGLNELFSCLDTLKSNEWNTKIDGVISTLVNDARVELGKTKKRKANTNTDSSAQPRTVCIMTETNKNSIQRNHASRNC